MVDSPRLPNPSAVPQILEAVIGQIEFAREYTLELLDGTPDEFWFTIPDGFASHLAWQVGHLTVSQYGLLLFRLRGRAPEDLELIPSRFRKAYSRGSMPSIDTTKQPSPDELRERLGRVHQLGLAQLREVPAEVLLEPVEMPYATFPIKLGAVMFCPLHEHIHAGQIGMIRRGHGLEPLR